MSLQCAIIGFPTSKHTKNKVDGELDEIQNWIVKP